MLARPTTDQILDDLAREVRDALIPATADPAMRVNLEMMEQLLAAAAVRAGHEIAWMHDEVETMIAYAADVADELDDEATRSALEAYERGRSDSLHLRDQVENYSLAGEALGRAIEAAGDHPELLSRGADIVRARKDTEALVRPGFYFPGRS